MSNPGFQCDDIRCNRTFRACSRWNCALPSTFRKIMRFCRAMLVLPWLLAPLAAPAAEWVPISSDTESVFYFDRASLKRQGDVVEVLLLWDFPEVQMTRRPIKPYLSATRLTRYECKAGQRANVESTLYRGPMASGDVTEVYRTPDEQLRFEWVNPQAPGGESMRRVCSAASENP